VLVCREQKKTYTHARATPDGNFISSCSFSLLFRSVGNVSEQVREILREFYERERIKLINFFFSTARHI
jgi:hypothetical protein